MRVGGVNARGDAEPGSDAAEELEQLGALSVGELGTEIPLGLDGEGKRSLEEIAARVGQVQGAGASVGGVLAAFEQAAGFELVDEGHHPARRDLEPLADGLLRATLVGGDGA
jgi:hypothetical protein